MGQPMDECSGEKLFPCQMQGSSGAAASVQDAGLPVNNAA